MNLLVIDKLHSVELCKKIAELIRTTWPRKDGTSNIAEDIERVKAGCNHAFIKNIMLFDQDELIGYARIFDREIKIGSALVNNMALASVCVKESHRNHGYGKQMVLKAFEFVDGGRFKCALFRTEEPAFYAKLGAKEIKNTVINSCHRDEPPFWAPHTVLYPGSYDAGDAVIDILGSGY